MLFHLHFAAFLTVSSHPFAQIPSAQISYQYATGKNLVSFFCNKKEILHPAISLSNPFCLNSVLLILTATDKEALAEYPGASPAALISCCFLFLHSLVFSADEKILHNLEASRNNSFRPHAGQFFPLPLRQYH